MTRNRTTSIILAGLVWFGCGHGATAQPDKELLTPGAAVPKFDPDEFVQGDAVPEIVAGTVYVIEFSGTQCVPCIAAIPLMERLQNRHQDAVFLTVFSEPAANVREFLNGNGRGMTGRVIADGDASLARSWSTAAGISSIPHVFVVDAQNKIAWIGRPNDLEQPLESIVQGTHAYATDPVERMQHEINKHMMLKRRAIYDRERTVGELNNRQVTELIQKAKYQEALELLNQLMRDHHDLPIVDGLRERKLLVLGRLNGTKDEAYALAREIIVDARLAGGVSKVGNCHCLLNSYEFAFDQNRDKNMLTMVFAYLAEFDPANLTPPDSVYYHRVAARVYRLDGDNEAARGELSKAIDAQKLYLKRLSETESREEVIGQERSVLETLTNELSKIENRN